MHQPVIMPKYDLLDLLHDQHVEIDGLLARLATRAPRAEVFLELAAKLAAHVAIESRVFYPAIMLESSELRRQSLAECQVIKRQVADMLALDPDGPDADEFDLALFHLGAAIRHHAHDFEEARLFPLLEELMDDAERRELGAQAATMYDALMARDDDHVIEHRIAA